MDPITKLCPGTGTDVRVRHVDDGTGTRRVLAITGIFGKLSPDHVADELAKQKMDRGDVILLSSIGGEVPQTMAIGREIRSRGLVTAIGEIDESGRLKPSLCAGACIIVFAGGAERLAISDSLLGGRCLLPPLEFEAYRDQMFDYFTSMGVSPKAAEAMSTDPDNGWVGMDKAIELKLATRPMRHAM